MNHVQFEVKVMNKIVTSKDDILSACKDIVADKGIQAINMRNVATHCKVAVGSIYNYFSSKDDLTIAVIDAIWKEIVQNVSEFHSGTGFVENVEYLFESIKNGGEKYPFFFDLHPMSIAKSGKEKGRETMNLYFDSVKKDLLFSLQNDNRVRQEFFSIKCSQKDFIEFVFSNLISLLIQKQDTCDVLLEIIKGTLYV